MKTISLDLSTPVGLPGHQHEAGGQQMLQRFVSYASEDADRARRFTEDLRRPGIDVWMADELKPVIRALPI